MNFSRALISLTAICLLYASLALPAAGRELWHAGRKSFPTAAGA